LPNDDLFVYWETEIMPTELYLGALGNNRTITNTIGGLNAQDTIGFSVNTTQALSVALSGLSDSSLVRLSRASFINGSLEAIADLGATSVGFLRQQQNSVYSRVLNPGNYILEISQSFGVSNYTANLSTNNPNQYFFIDQPYGAQTYSGFVGNGNSSDRYQFQLNSSSDLNLRLAGMNEDADLRLGRDLNLNGVIDAGEQIAISNRSYNLDEVINRSGLAAGSYIVEVFRFNTSNTQYRLGITTTATNVSTAGIDLVGQLTVSQIPDIRITNNSGQAQIVVTNQGTRTATGPVTVGIYASTNDAYDSNDELLMTRTLNLNLTPGQSTTYGLNFAAPTGIAPGSYYLLGRVDINQNLVETNEQNNLSVQHVSAPGTDVILDWNATLLNAIQAVNVAPPLAARNQAIVHAAMFDAVNAIQGQFQSFLPNLSVQLSSYLSASEIANASAIAAAAQAAFQTLSDLFPSQRSEFARQLARSLAEVPDGSAENNGILIGQIIADELLIARLNDNSAGAQDAYTPPTGVYTFESPRVDNWVALPGWGNVTPFAIPSVRDRRFQLNGPPAFGSTQYANELNQVQNLGGINSVNRTADQSEVAVFWAYDRPDTFRPPGQWNQIAEEVSLRSGTSLLANARLFALMNIAQADAGIAAWATKYQFNQPRPISVIHELAALDGLANTSIDPNWQPFLNTPPFPDYVSGHSTFGAAAAGVLAAFYGNNYSFTTSSQEIPGTFRTFRSFQEAAAENGISRIYGGIHVQSANLDGQALGYQVASYVVNNLLL
jgi:membrane-associated phospholipid phosphatase